MERQTLLDQLDCYTDEELIEMIQLYESYKRLPECQEAVKILLEIIKIQLP